MGMTRSRQEAKRNTSSLASNAGVVHPQTTMSTKNHSASFSFNTRASIAHHHSNNVPKSGRVTAKATQRKPDIAAANGGIRNQATMHTSLEPTSRVETKNVSQNCSEQVSLMNTEKQPNKPSTSEIPPALRN